MTLLALDDRRWREFVESRPDSTIFHHPMWAKLLADCYGYRAMAVSYAAAGCLIGMGAIWHRSFFGFLVAYGAFSWAWIWFCFARQVKSSR